MWQSCVRKYHPDMYDTNCSCLCTQQNINQLSKPSHANICLSYMHECRHSQLFHFRMIHTMFIMYAKLIINLKSNIFYIYKKTYPILLTVTYILVFVSRTVNVCTEHSVCIDLSGWSVVPWLRVHNLITYSWKLMFCCILLLVRLYICLKWDEALCK